MIEPTQPRKSLFLHILFTGLVAGTLDIGAALLNYYVKTGNDPVNVLKFVASGLIGARGFGDDPAIPFIGLLVHYFIAFCWIIFFFLGYNLVWRKVPTVLLRAVFYGLLVYGLMNFVVVPLTPAPALTKTIASASLEAMILVVCIGLPAAVGALLYSKPRKA